MMPMIMPAPKPLSEDPLGFTLTWPIGNLLYN
jgi:hypothetical protein